MSDQNKEQQWWTALCGWVERQQGGADCLFVYDRQQGRLERCFGRSVTLREVDDDTVRELYQAASEGRFGLLRPNEGTPQLLTEDLDDLLEGDAGMDQRELEWLERKRKEQTGRLKAQDRFIWTAVSEKREQEQLEARMELRDQADSWLRKRADAFMNWQAQMAQISAERLEDMSREFHDMDVAGAGEEEYQERIRSYLDGKPPVRQREPEEGQGAEVIPVSGEMWGNMLRQFCRFAASEVPLSMGHMKVAEHCRRILQQVNTQGLGLDKLGLDPQEQSVVLGTIELGTLVERGLRAQMMLGSGRKLSVQQYQGCLRDFLAMRGVEEVLSLHVGAHREVIRSGEGPVSGVQILMAHKGFRADDLREKAGRTHSMARLESMGRETVAKMIRQKSRALSAMGRQVMIDSYQMGDVRRSEAPHSPSAEAQKKGGPRI